MIPISARYGMLQIASIAVCCSVALAEDSPLLKRPARSFVGTKAGQVRDDNGLKMKLVWCPPGKFTMGSPKDEKKRNANESQVEVTLTKGFWLGKYEVTQGQWKRVMRTTPWSGKKHVEVGDDYPVTYVSWLDEVQMCSELTSEERRGTGATLGSRRITIAGNSAAEAQAAQFTKRYAPPTHDAQTLLDGANREALKTGRRLLFVEGGPRREPCREMARWMDDQHALLSKDYVILKVLDTDTHYGDVIGKFRSNRGGGIPWFAIAEPDGTVLATSDSPLGNTGFPSSFEGKKYLKHILDHTARHLAPAERERLIESLPND